MKKAILFDFDGVLVESIPQHMEAWAEVCPAAGFQPHEETVRLTEGSKAWQICQAMAKYRGVDLPEEQARQLAEEKNRIFRRNGSVRVFEQVPELISVAKQFHLKTAVVTGTSKKNLRATLPEDIYNSFDFIVCDENSPKGKPDPGPYLTAVHYFGLRPEECLVIENAPLGIRAATTAGIFTVALATTLPREHLSRADVIYNDHAELLNHLPELIGQ